MDPRPGQFSSVSSEGFTSRGTIDRSVPRVHVQAGRAGRRLELMLFGRLVAMLVAGTLVALVPLAHASPPDPTWISAFTTTLTTTIPCARSPRESASQRMTDRPT